MQDTFGVKVQDKEDSLNFCISGSDQGLKKAVVNMFSEGIEVLTHVVNQPGLRNFLRSGDLDVRIKKIEDQENCFIRIEENPGPRGTTYQSRAVDSATSGFVTSSGSNTLVTAHGHPSWKSGDIMKEQDQALMGVFNQEAMKLRNPTGTARITDRTGGMEVEVIQGDITQETTEAIVNVIGSDMDMSNFGQLSKIIAVNSGRQVQQECRQIGRQSPGSAVITSGGRLAVKKIIHIVTGSSDKAHLQRCLEKGLRLADTNGIKSISVPAIGTGGYGLSAAESAQMIFQALKNLGGNFRNISKVHIVVFQAKMIKAFQQEHHKKSLLTPLTAVAAPSMFSIPVKVDVVTGDLTKESSEAIVNVIGRDLNMKNFGQLSNSIAQKCGPQVQQELNQKGTQAPGSAVMTSGGALIAKHIIHIVAATADEQHLQTCLEKGLRLADANGIKSISIPAFGASSFGLSVAESAQVIFQALRNVGGHFTSISTVRIVVFRKQMAQAFFHEQQKYSLPPRMTASQGSSGNMRVTLPSSKLTVKVWVTGGKHNVEKAMGELKALFSSACITKKVDLEGIGSLSELQVKQLKSEADKCDVEITVNKTLKSIMLQGFSADFPDMVTKITAEINKGVEKEKKKQKDDNAHLVSEVVEWSYTLNAGRKQVFDKTTNADLEMARSKHQSSSTVLVNGKLFVIDLNSRTGRFGGEQMEITRTLKGANMSEGIPLPDNWAPMTTSHEKVTLVPLKTHSNEYQNVLLKFQASFKRSFPKVQKIERVQNPELYRTFMVKKQAMDKRCGGKSERKLFHGTDAKSIKAINSQGFNRSLCGKNGTVLGRGVYFARDASFSFGYAGGAGGGGGMYLARVLVGDYCLGSSDFLTPPPKDRHSPDIIYDSVVDNILNPTVFVVFNDGQCYPEYIIRF